MAEVWDGFSRNLGDPEIIDPHQDADGAAALRDRACGDLRPHGSERGDNVGAGKRNPISDPVVDAGGLSALKPANVSTKKSE